MKTVDKSTQAFHTFLTCLIYFPGFNAGANEDLAFMETAAHEFGHDVLMASGGLSWSWGHEGTSGGFFYSRRSASAPSRPATGELNLMKYYQGGPVSYDR